MAANEQPDLQSPNEVIGALWKLGFADAEDGVPVERLTGGVSSDIWRVDLPSGPVCVKRALAKLKVAADWRAPVERNAFEAAWIRTVMSVEPDAAPELLAEDRRAGLFVMRYLDPAEHPVWKLQLRDGAKPAVAAEVGRRLGRIHAATAGNADLGERFATDHIFHPIRLEPYLLATARVHADRAAALEALVEITAKTRKCLVHGDVSPKNILIGPRGPVFLDAECAWYGDPAFDLAFCLNHLMLKCLWTPSSAAAFLACFDALAKAYCETVIWEPVELLERRTARLLPGLFLARIDGKSPAEYVTQDKDKDSVRRVARELLAKPVNTPAAVRAAWQKEIGCQ